MLRLCTSPGSREPKPHAHLCAGHGPPLAFQAFMMRLPATARRSVRQDRPLLPPPPPAVTWHGRPAPAPLPPYPHVDSPPSLEASGARRTPPASPARCPRDTLPGSDLLPSPPPAPRPAPQTKAAARSSPVRPPRETPQGPGPLPGGGRAPLRGGRLTEGPPALRKGPPLPHRAEEGREGWGGAGGKEGEGGCGAARRGGSAPAPPLPAGPHSPALAPRRTHSPRRGRLQRVPSADGARRPTRTRQPRSALPLPPASSPYL